MSLRRLLLATTLLVVPTLAGAQPVSGLYIGAGGGWNGAGPNDIDVVGAGARGRAVYDSGFAGVLALGWGFGNGIRAEIEGNYRQNDVRKLDGFGGAPFSKPNGFQRSYGVMANAYYDFDLANFGFGPSTIQPYVGLGAGYVWDEMVNVSAAGAGFGGARLRMDDTSRGRFAYQGIIGAAMPLTLYGIRGLSLTAEYRFLGTLDQRLNAELRTPNNAAVLARGRVDAENFNHTVMLGLRYAFNQPAPAPMMAPAPAPAPAAAPARTYLVFFDFDRADLTARAREIITDAAQNARRVSATRIEVAGHADRSGTPQYNDRLSRRRADAVAGELVRQGVSRNEITVTAFGESRPLVPTADGVREPQNRRVEIVLR